MAVVDKRGQDEQTMRHFIQSERRKRSQHLSAQLERARADFRAIVDHIVTHYHPQRVYQWGSLVDGNGFQEISDIDVAIAGLNQPEVFFRLLAECAQLTSFRLDIVNLEDIHPLYRTQIVEKGVLIYERPLS